MRIGDWRRLKSMAAGKPVISVNRGGPLETVVHEKSGFLIEPCAEEFAKAMERLADSPSLVRIMGKMARARAMDFTWNRFAAGLDDKCRARCGITRLRPEAFAMAQ